MVTVRQETTNSFLFIPTTYIFFNIVIACLLSLITEPDPGGLLNQAESMIGFLTSTSIGIVTLTFSLTVLSIQIAAQTYSPRLLDVFLRDPISKIAVAINLGAFSYGFTLTYFLRDPDEVPYVAIHFLSVHMISVLLMFVAFIHFFINGLRLESILHAAGEKAWRAAQALEKLQRADDIQDFDEMPKVPSEDAFKVLADQSGYVVRYHLGGTLIRMAEKLDLCIRYHPNIGEFVPEGTLLAYVWDAKTTENRKSMKTRIIMHATSKQLLEEECSSTNMLNCHMRARDKRSEKWVENLTEERLGVLVASGVEMSTVRYGQLDVLLGIQTINDVAVKALSAAINDPMTAIQALDYLSMLFARLAHLSFAIGCKRDSKGLLRVSAPRRSFTYLLSVLDGIRFYGGGDLQVMYRLIRFYGDLGAGLKRLKKLDRMPAVLAQMEQCMVVARKNFKAESMEFRSIEEVYQYSMGLMSTSDGPILKENEALEKDLSALETTFEKPTYKFVESLPDSMRNVLDSEDIRSEISQTDIGSA